MDLEISRIVGKISIDSVRLEFIMEFGVTRSAPVGRFEPSWGQSLSVSRRDARPGHEGVVSAWPLVDENRVPCGLRSFGAGYAVRSAARRLSCRAGHRWPAPIETGRTGEPE